MDTGDIGRRVLVLNRLWQAVNIVGVRRAFALLFQEHARVIHPTEGGHEVFGLAQWIDFSGTCDGADSDFLHTVRLRVRIPHVLLLTDYDRVPMQEVKFTRQNLFERDNYTCQYCGRTLPPRELNLDHVIPRDRGGKTTWENIVTSCVRCNARKANRLPHEASMRLRAKPERPRWRPFVSVAADSHFDEAWAEFLHAGKS